MIFVMKKEEKLEAKTARFGKFQFEEVCWRERNRILWEVGKNSVLLFGYA